MLRCLGVVDLAYFTREDTIILNVMVDGSFHKISLSETHTLSLLKQLVKGLEEQWTSIPRK